jgi:Sulfotransferase domain
LGAEKQQSVTPGVSGNAKGRRLPDFLGVGPPRSATSWLDAVLRGHVGLPRDIKEVDFFVKNYARGVDWYMGYFADCDKDLPIGEICPSYFGSDEARKRIAEHIPECRLICTFRDPVEMIYSMYKLARRNVWTRGNFESYVPVEWHHHATKLKKWRETFGRDHVLACFYDDLAADAQAYLDPICDFIGISRIPIGQSGLAKQRINTFSREPRSPRIARRARKLRDWLEEREAYRAISLLTRAGFWRFCFEGGEEFEPLDPGIEARLRDRFRPAVEELEEVAGRDLSAWKRGRSGTPASSSAAQT